MSRLGAGLFFAASLCLSGQPAQEPAGLLDAARRNAADFTEALPDYICSETIRRFQTRAGANAWRQTDALVLQVSYSGGEEYQLISIDGAPANHAYEGVSGAASRGEFGSWLKNIFDPSSAADFRWQGRDKARQRAVAVYSFHVTQANSRYNLSYQDVSSQGVMVGYHGLMFIDTATNRVTRITIEADGIPPNFPLRRSSVELQYDFIAIAGRPYLLPLYSDTHLATDKTEFRNETLFGDYRKFEAESTIRFGDSTASRANPALAAAAAPHSEPQNAALPPELARFNDESPAFPPPVAPSVEEQRAIIDDARRAALAYVSSPPGLVCTDQFRIYESPAGRESWKLRSALTAEFKRPTRGPENYNVTSIDKSHANDDASLQAEFAAAFKATTWRRIFDKLAASILLPQVEFHWERIVNLRGRETLVYSFATPGRSGSVYVDRASRRVTRIFTESQPPASYTAMLLDFAFIGGIGGRTLLYPLRAVSREDSKTLATRYESAISACAKSF